MQNKESYKKINKIITKAQADGEFRAKLLADPLKTLKVEGIELPAGMESPFIERIKNLFCSEQPGQLPLTDERLGQVTAGVGKDPHKPCGNSTCTAKYDSLLCWGEWLASLGQCKYHSYGGN